MRTMYEHKTELIPMGGSSYDHPKVDSPEFRRLEAAGWRLVGWTPRKGYTSGSCVFCREKLPEEA